MKLLRFLPVLALIAFAVPAGAQCNPQYPATCVRTFQLWQPYYQPPRIHLSVPRPIRPHPIAPIPRSRTETYTDRYGNHLGYGHIEDGITTYTDPYGNLLGRKNAW